MIKLAKPTIDKLEINAVVNILRTGNLVQGKYVQEFEDLLASQLGVRHVVVVSSGTAALHLAILVLGIGPGDEVIVPDFTFPATANVVALTGAIPVPVDIDPLTYNINPDLIAQNLTVRTKAILPVHLFGQSAAMKSIRSLARKHQLKVIEDAACAIGAVHHGHPCGCWGDLACFSFHPRKIITTGEGGAIATNNSTYAKQLRLLRNHGMEVIKSKGVIDFVLPGFNYRMTDFQAALGIEQMNKLDRIIAGRQQIARFYDQHLSGVNGVFIPTIAKNNNHVYQSYVVRLDTSINRAKVISFLKAHGIEATIGTYALHCTSFYKRQRQFTKVSLPVSKLSVNQTLTLPFHGELTNKDLKYIVDMLKQAIHEG